MKRCSAYNTMKPSNKGVDIEEYQPLKWSINVSFKFTEVISLMSSQI